MLYEVNLGFITGVPAENTSEMFDTMDMYNEGSVSMSNIASRPDRVG